jgi:peptidyl-tRNA hydrolase, PTH1 family
LKEETAAHLPYLIAGLGNPGPEYTWTRHNIGFIVLDRLAERLGASWKRESKWQGAVAKTADSHWLLKPSTYMNRSGDSIQPVAAYYKIPPERIVVVFDDLALPLGRLRLRANGSAGGHNGAQSAIERLGTDRFLRVRIGIGAGPGSMVDHVLGRFQTEEMPVVAEVVDRAADAVECLLARGFEAAMNKFNSTNSKKETNHEKPV